MVPERATVIERPMHSNKLNFQRFRLKDQALVNRFVEDFSPQSCEYNFVNLFAWQDIYHTTWTLYKGRMLIYDGLSQTAYMPLGADLLPEELVILSLHLQQQGMSTDFGLVTRQYLETYPDIEEYYYIEEQRDAAEYIYDVNRLVELSGAKLHKKKNLISQFKKYYPDYQVHPMTGQYLTRALAFSKTLLECRKRRSKTLDQEMEAIRTAFNNFAALHLEGLVLTLNGQLIAYAVFSRISESTYDIQFEKSDPDFKGASQVINHETVKYLKGKCLFVNREQDLGIKGLRQAKLSYDPVDLLTPYGLNFNPPN
jgi:hypothetical protein